MHAKNVRLDDGKVVSLPKPSWVGEYYLDESCTLLSLHMGIRPARHTYATFRINGKERIRLIDSEYYFKYHHAVTHPPSPDTRYVYEPRVSLVNRYGMYERVTMSRVYPDWEGAIALPEGLEGGDRTLVALLSGPRKPHRKFAVVVNRGKQVYWENLDDYKTLFLMIHPIGCSWCWDTVGGHSFFCPYKPKPVDPPWLTALVNKP